jgi:hypothetical protein
MHDGGQFGWSSIYTQLRRQDILPKPVLDIGGVEVKLYMIGDSAYPSRPYLLKNFKPSVTDPVFFDNRRFDQSMNSGRFVIE